MKTKKQKKVVVGYVRTAAVSQDRNGLSTKIQGEKIKEFCKAKGYRLSKIFSDSGCSGANLNRPALQELVAEASRGKISKVICIDTDRLSRNTMEYLFLKNFLTKHGTEIVFMTGTPVNGDSFSKCMEEMFAVMNSFQPRLRECEHKQTELTNSVASSKNGGGRMTHVRITVSKKDLDNCHKFLEIVEDEPLNALGCGLSKSQIVLIAKILRLNLENTTEVKADFQF